MRRATAAVCSAMSASCSAVGRSLTVVSAMNTVWLCPTMTWMPNGVRPGAASITRFTSRIDIAQVRVIPVIIASPSPSWSSAAPKMLRSWLTIRSTSRRR